MAFMLFGPLGSVSPIFQVFPKSGVDSIRKFHPLPSTLEGSKRFPLSNKTGLFFIGPKKPSGNFSGSDHESPPSLERINMPHQVDGLGPTL